MHEGGVCVCAYACSCLHVSRGILHSPSVFPMGKDCVHANTKLAFCSNCTFKLVTLEQICVFKTVISTHCAFSFVFPVVGLVSYACSICKQALCFLKRVLSLYLKNRKVDR